MKTITILNNASFKAAIKNIKSIKTKHAIPFMECVCINAGANVPYMEKFDSESVIRYNLKGTISGDGTAYVNFDEFVAGIKNAKKNETITIEVDGKKVILVVGAIRKTLSDEFISDKEWPKFHQFGSDGYQSRTCMLTMSNIKRAVKCTENDANRPIFDCVNINSEYQSVVSSNGAVMYVGKLPITASEPIAINIPSKYASMLDGEYSVICDHQVVNDKANEYASFALFTSLEGMQIGVRCNTSHYPKWRNIVSRTIIPRHAFKFNPEEVAECVNMMKTSKGLNPVVFQKKDDSHFAIKRFTCDKVFDMEMEVSCECNPRVQDFSVDVRNLIKVIDGWNGTIYVDGHSYPTLEREDGFNILGTTIVEDVEMRKEEVKGEDYIDFLAPFTLSTEPTKPAEPTQKADAPAEEKHEELVKESPIMRQYSDLKKKHPDAVLLFRCGDFYEAYEDDAVACAEILGITLTCHSDNKIRMAGFPHHALDTYLPKLVRAGKRVAICDQIEDTNTKKDTKRGITELVSPGTVKPTTESKPTPAPEETAPEEPAHNTRAKNSSKPAPLSDMAADRLADILENVIKEGNANGWKKPWTNSVFVNGGMAPHNVMTGRAYGELNAFMLSALCAFEGFKTPCFVTMLKLRELGLTIKSVEGKDGNKKRCIGTPVLEKFLTSEMRTTKDDEGNVIPMKDEDGNVLTKTRQHRHTTWVWNLDETDFPEKYPERYAELVKSSENPSEYVFKNKHDDDWQDDAFDLMLNEPKNYWVVKSVDWGGNRAYYCDNGTIQLPMRRQFKSARYYYATAAHEMIHSTNEVRPRNYGSGKYNKEGYATEELVAELGSAIICHDLGIEKEIDENHKHYAANWAQALHGEDRRDVVRRIVQDILDATGIWFAHYRKAEKALGLEHQKPETSKIGSTLSKYKQEDEGSRPVMVRRYSEASILVAGGSKADRIGLTEAINDKFPAEKNKRGRMVQTAKIWQSPLGMGVLIRVARVSDEALRTLMKERGLSTEDWDTTKVIKVVADGSKTSAPAPVRKATEEKKATPTDSTIPAPKFTFVQYSEKGVILQCEENDVVTRAIIDAAALTLGICSKWYPAGKLSKKAPAGYCLSKKAAAKLEKQLNAA